MKIPAKYLSRDYHRVNCTSNEVSEMSKDPEHGSLKFITHIVEDDGRNVIIYKWQTL